MIIFKLYKRLTSPCVLICLYKMVSPLLSPATFVYCCHKAQIRNYNAEKKRVITEILYFNFQSDIACDKYLLYSILCFMISPLINNLAILKCLECVHLGHPYTFYSWPFLDKTRDCLEEKKHKIAKGSENVFLLNL